MEKPFYSILLLVSLCGLGGLASRVKWEIALDPDGGFSADLRIEYSPPKVWNSLLHTWALKPVVHSPAQGPPDAARDKRHAPTAFLSIQPDRGISRRSSPLCLRWRAGNA